MKHRRHLDTTRHENKLLLPIKRLKFPNGIVAVAGRFVVVFGHLPSSVTRGACLSSTGMFENWPFRRYTFLMAEIPVPQVLPEEVQATQTRAEETLDPGYVVICWDDPVNLMDYVTHVFMTIFGWQRPKAEQHMLQVHRQGKSILTRDGLERAEHYVHRLQSYGLTATLERAE